MKKITQNLTNVKAWQSTIFAFMFLFSLTINAQEVGDEFLANPGVNTTAVDAETGYDAAGTFNNNGNGNYGGWTAGTGGAYASATTANGDCHSPDRMFRLFKTGGTDGQFINQIVTALPAGNYNFGFWNKWDATSSNDEALPTWSADGDNEPKFTIKVQDEAGAWVTVHTHVPAEPTADMTWTEETGTWTNEETRDVRVMFYKNGGTGNAPSNLNNLWYIDTATLNYASALEATSDCDFSITLTDSYGDSWNGGSVDVSVGGVVVLDDITVSSTDNAGDFATYTFGVNDGDEISVVYTAGSYSYENEYEVFDNSGAVIASSGQGGSTPADSTTTASCIDLTAPAMSVTATTGVASATFSFDIDNFVVGDTDGVDGHIHYVLNGGNEVMVYSSDDLTLSDLPDGDHTIVFSLRDPSHAPLDPAVEATVEFSTFDGSYDCGDTQSYTYMSGSGGGFGFDSSFTEADASELIFTVTPAAGENVTLVIGGETENNYDWIYVTDEAGTVVYGPATGPQDVTVTTTGAANVYVSADTSVTKTLTFAITCAGPPAPLMLQGILDLDQSGSTGKGIHVVANADIENLSVYGIGVANNGNGSNGQEYTFPAVSVSAGDNIMLARDMDVYAAYFEMDVATFTQANNDISQNGDDAIELFFNGEVIETFGDIDTDGTGEAWEYMDSWAYKVDGAWTYGGVNCTDDAETNATATCVYPFTGVYTTGTEVQVNTYTITFNVNTSNIEVGPNGMFVGGGFVDELLGGGANALPMTDEDADGVWTASMVVPEGTTGNYTYINSTDNYDGKEDIAGQDCADADNWNDRVLDAPVTEDITFTHCYGSCLTDGTCPSTYYTLTFNLNTATIDVGPNGMFVGGGFVEATLGGGANALPMTDADGDGIWTATMQVIEGTSGNYTYVNSTDNYDGKEDISGQECADADNWNDRVLDAPITEDTTLNHCYGYCGDSCPTGPAAIVAPWSDDFEDGDVSDWIQYQAGDESAGWTLSAGEMTHTDDDVETGVDNYFISPLLDCTGLTAPLLSYTEYQTYATTWYEYHSVSYSEDYDGENAATATWTELVNGSAVIGAANAETQEFAIPNTATAVAFRYTGDYADNWFVDNVSVTETPGEPNDVTADPANAWVGYMTVFALNEDGTQGGYQFGSGWAVADLQTTLNPDTPNIVLEPNFNTYANAIADGSAGELDYWTDGAGGGNKFMEATTQVESTETYNNSDLTFTGSVYENTLIDGYNAVYFIKCLDPNAGYSDMLDGAYVFPIEPGEFSVTVDGSMLPAGKLVQFGFTVYGPNANAENDYHGRVVIGDAGLSVSDNTPLDMVIYPNPSNGSYVTIQTPVNGVKYVEVFDITGKRLINTSLSADTLDVSSISSGMYLVKVTVEGQSKTSKLIIR